MKERESGLAVAELCRKHGISAATYYAWKSKYAGASVSDLTRMKKLEAEYAWLNVLYDGRNFRTLNVINEANREVLAIEVAQSLLKKAQGDPAKAGRHLW